MDSASFCEYCGAPQRQRGDVTSGGQETVAVAAGVEQKHENVLAGFVGALLGAAIGGGSIILLSQLNLVASISGLILAVCTLKGYELLGGVLSRKGMVLCLILMVLTPYFADRLDWAIVILREFGDYGITFGDAYSLVPVLLEDEAIEASNYYGNLAMIYFFVLLGGFSTIFQQVRGRK